MLRVFAIVFLFIIRCRFSKSKVLADVIHWRYDNHVLRIIRTYEKLEYRNRKLELDIQFLKICLNNDPGQHLFDIKFQINVYRTQKLMYNRNVCFYTKKLRSKI